MGDLDPSDGDGVRGQGIDRAQRRFVVKPKEEDMAKEFVGKMIDGKHPTAPQMHCTSHDVDGGQQPCPAIRQAVVRTVNLASHEQNP